MCPFKGGHEASNLTDLRERGSQISKNCKTYSNFREMGRPINIRDRLVFQYQSKIRG